MTSYIPILSCRVEIINEHEQLHPSASVDTVEDTVHPSNMNVSVLVCVCVCVCLCSSPVHSLVSFPDLPLAVLKGGLGPRLFTALCSSCFTECVDMRVSTGCLCTIFWCFLQFSEEVLQGRRVAFHTVPKVKPTMHKTELCITTVLCYVMFVGWTN